MSWEVRQGDCVEAMQAMEPASVDAVVCDPPYGLEFMGKEWDRLGDVRQPGDAGFHEGSGPFARAKVRYGGTPSYGWESSIGKTGYGDAERLPRPNYGSTRNPMCRTCRKHQRGRDGCECDEPDFDQTPATANQRMQEWHQAWATEALRVLKPGGHLLAFGGTRTYHRLVCAVEDAGFEIRDTISYLYGSGFPKSLNLDRLRGDTFCGCGDGEAIPEHHLPRLRDGDVSEAVPTEGGQGALLLAGLPQSGASPTGPVPPEGRPREQERVMEGRSDVPASEGQLRPGAVRESADVGVADGPEGRLRDGAPLGDGADGRLPADQNGVRPPSGSRPAEQRPGELGALAGQPLSQDGGAWEACGGCGLPIVPSGLGTALKPAHEPVVVARKPLSGTVAQTVLEYGTGALNVDGCRVEGGPRPHIENAGRADPGTLYGDGKAGSRLLGETTAGRWPANVVLDEAAGAMLDEQSGERQAGARPARRGAGTDGYHGWPNGTNDGVRIEMGSGGASRFFYTAKVSRGERNAGLEGFEERGITIVGNGVAERFNPICENTGQRRQQCACGEHRVSEDTTPKRTNHHPTVKPIALMRWLVRLVTPPNGLVLDPFAGSGTTGCAAVLEGFDFIGIEREPEYVEIAKARIAYWADPDAHNLRMAEAERLAEKAEAEAEGRAYQLDIFDALGDAA